MVILLYVFGRAMESGMITIKKTKIFIEIVFIEIIRAEIKHKTIVHLLFHFNGTFIVCTTLCIDAKSTLLVLPERCSRCFRVSLFLSLTLYPSDCFMLEDVNMKRKKQVIYVELSHASAIC